MVGLCCGLLACVEPTANRPPAGSSAALIDGSRNLQVLFQGRGWGRVQFRQPEDGVAKVFFITWVRELEPRTQYLLQQAVDSVIDGSCTGGSVPSDWVTIGANGKPQTIYTDPRGSAHLPLNQLMPRHLVGTTLESQLRIINASTGEVVLQSGCFQFEVSL
jgi:hypothetical protein